MKSFLKKTAIFLAAVLLFGALPVLAEEADEDRARVVLGADLNEDEIASVYSVFGIDRGDVAELTVTNAEERARLNGVVEEERIGTYAISCVYIQVLEEGQGLSVDTHNIDWCTAELYKNALITAGVCDAKVIIASPYEVSGTAALTGIYKAYEDATGDTIPEEAKEAAVNELIIASEIADELGEADTSAVVNELKRALDQTGKMTDDEIRDQIKSVADKVGVTLTEKQIEQLISLVRALEKMDPQALASRVDQAKEIAKGASDYLKKASNVFTKLADFFKAIWDKISGLFG